MKNTTLTLLSFFLILSTGLAQDNRQDIKVKDIKVTLEQSPRYTLQGSQPQSDSSRKWLVVEAYLECDPDWSDEVTVKFYVVANYSEQSKADAPKDRFDILAANVTVVNVPKGRKNIVPVFLDPNSVKKYAQASIQSFVPQVAVQVYYKGKLQDSYWMTGVQKGVQFWEQKQPRGGVLLNFLQSPWWPAYSDYYEQVKPASAAPAF